MSFLRPLGLGLLASLSLLASAADPRLGQTWLDHAKQDLLPWWTHVGAQGEPIGRFPTFRCNDGSAYRSEAPCSELADPPAWIKPELGRQYVRMQSRQIYAYAMGFQLTGDIKLLQLAEAGVRDLRQRALDHRSGSAASWFENGKPMPAIGLRTSQDLSYAALGLASVYYLTRDAQVLADLIRLKQHIFNTYQDKQTGLIKWVAKDDGSGEAEREELVATLDQLNAYLILVTPALPEGPLKQRWQNDIAQLSKAMIARFHDPATGQFWGTRGAADSESAEGRHNDYGHTIKAYWMLYLGAQQNRDAALAEFAREGMRKVLAQAWLADTGSWGEKRLADGSSSNRKSWWIYAELSQAAATLAMLEGDDAERWHDASQWWLAHFVDRQHGEVWGSLPANGQSDGRQLKQHHWKNGFHSMEHALIGYLSAQTLAKQASRLYFALPPSRKAPALRPYLFDATVLKVQQQRIGQRNIQQVDFLIMPQRNIEKTTAAQ